VTLRSWRSIPVVLALLALAAPLTARALPTYSRKYATSCITCHTVYPKLTAFGEAFRRNGFRFPGVVDSDYVKLDLVNLGQEANKRDFPDAVWPSFLTSVPQVGFAFTASPRFHPGNSINSAYATSVDKHTTVNFDTVARSGNLYISSSIDDNITFQGWMNISDTGASVSETAITWADIVGPRGVANLSVGYGFPTLSPWARGSAYVGGKALFGLSLSALYGQSGTWSPLAAYSFLEVNGITAAGRLEYGAGLTPGVHSDGGPPRDFYGHVAYKFGGMRLDGEGNYVPSDPKKWWSEYSTTLYGFVYKSTSRWATPALAAATDKLTPDGYTKGYVLWDDGMTYGGGARFNVASAELSVGGLYDKHNHVTQVKGPDGLPGGATQIAAYADLSYIVFPWLVPAVRAEHVIVQPTRARAAKANDTRLLPVIAALIRPNFKVTVSGILERAGSIPADNVLAGKDPGWTSGSGLYLTSYSKDKSIPFQLSTVNLSANISF
jgi:hypothetical protein